MDLRSNFVQLLTEDRSDIEWQKASADLPHLRIICEDGDKRSFTYNVQVHMEKEYQICYSSLQPVQFVPSVPLDRDFAKYRVVELLDHMTTYKYIEGIENRLSTQSLSKSFNARMYMSDDEKSRSTENCVLEVTVGQEFTFEIINLSEDVLHIYLYALRPDWSIVDQLTEFRSTERVELGPVYCRFKTTFKATLSQNFPSDHVTSEDEVFKLFVTRRADSFAGLRMDALSSSPRRGTLNTLKDFLAARRDRRRGGSDSDHEEEWFTKNFIVKTKAVST
ncbi:hypothetical protein T440DRAFT_398567 [Plenodomus tracheiphilus IPT5]|uniref:Uncharacterized protein n=1 Tax=Plenodomus tracheiphilus IPT5 TaxID=1408161 RepID=A0A6A7B3E3_9PLEO|nr:hypothetical protein T440DRAFT_398567 [Plenodomus tracheiphilus IPT5]